MLTEKRTLKTSLFFLFLFFFFDYLITKPYKTLRIDFFSLKILIISDPYYLLVKAALGFTILKKIPMLFLTIPKIFSEYLEQLGL